MSHKEVALAFNNCINNHDIKNLSKLMSSDYKFIDAEGGGFNGKEKSIKIWKEFFKKYPEYKNIFDSVQAKGELVIMIGRSICSNKKLEGKGIWTAKLKEKKVLEWRVYFDTKENRKLLNIK